MLLKIKTGIVVLLLVAAGVARSAAAGSDTLSVGCTSILTEKIMLLRCPWSESANAASLICTDCRDRVAGARAGFDHVTGDYRLFQQPEEINRYGFYTHGWSSLGNWRFYGKFSYFNEISDGTRWASVIEPYTGNPYSVGDSVGGTYTREYFIMEGKSALQISSRLAMGIDINYKTGVGAKRKDPRPENNLTDFEISPGIIWSQGRLKLGAHLRFKTGKEEISFISVTGNKFELYYFRGLGAYSMTMEGDSRYTGTLIFGGGVEGNYNGSGVKNLTSLRFNHQITGIKRGDHYPLQVVSLDTYSTDASSLFLFTPEENRLSRLKFSYNREKSYGNEPVVEPKLEAISWQWSTAAKYTLYWNSASRAGIDYGWYRLRDRHHIRYGGTLSAALGSEETTYYFVPEYNRQKISYYTLGASLEKGWLAGRNQLVTSLSGNFRGIPSKSLELTGDETLRNGILIPFVEHDFGYFSSTRWEGGVLINYGREISGNRLPFQLFVEGGFKVRGSDFSGGSRRQFLSLSTGIHF